MNIILLKNENKTDGDNYLIREEKFYHLKKTLKVKIEQKVFVGKINGKMGYAKVIEINSDNIILDPKFDLNPPTPLPIKIVIALPRPKMLRRILRNASMLGIKDIYLINTEKVEKSFWQSKLLQKESLETYLLQGLEQSKDTVIPKLELRDKFKPFVEDELPNIIKDTTPLLAHPGDYPAFPQGTKESLTIAIGPEGGFTNYEIEKLNQIGFDTFQLGSRILRTEVALISLISQHALISL